MNPPREPPGSEAMELAGSTLYRFPLNGALAVNPSEVERKPQKLFRT